MNIGPLPPNLYKADGFTGQPKDGVISKEEFSRFLDGEVAAGRMTQDQATQYSLNFDRYAGADGNLDQQEQFNWHRDWKMEGEPWEEGKPLEEGI